MKERAILLAVRLATANRYRERAQVGRKFVPSLGRFRERNCEIKSRVVKRFGNRSLERSERLAILVHAQPDDTVSKDVLRPHPRSPNIDHCVDGIGDYFEFRKCQQWVSRDGQVPDDSVPSRLGVVRNAVGIVAYIDRTETIVDADG